MPAFALPVFTTKARTSKAAFFVAAKCSLQICTGAAQKRFLVNTPATLEPAGNSITNTSLRPGRLMPASA